MSKVSTSIEVRYQETDQMGVVYHANYLTWFEIGRTKFIETLGFNYAAMEAEKVVSPVTQVHISYHKPATYGDTVRVDTWLAEYNGIRTTYAYEVFNEEDELLVRGETEHVIVNQETFRPLSLRKRFPDWHEAYMKKLKESK